MSNLAEPTQYCQNLLEFVKHEDVIAINTLIFDVAFNKKTDRRAHICIIGTKSQAFVSALCATFRAIAPNVTVEFDTDVDRAIQTVYFKTDNVLTNRNNSLTIVESCEIATEIHDSQKRINYRVIPCVVTLVEPSAVVVPEPAPPVERKPGWLW